MRKTYFRDPEKEKSFTKRQLIKFRKVLIVGAFVQIALFVILGIDNLDIEYLVKIAAFAFVIWTVIYWWIRYIAYNSLSDYEMTSITLKENGIERKIEDQLLFLEYADIVKIKEGNLGTVVYKSGRWSIVERIMGSRTGERAMKNSIFIPDVLKEYDELMNIIKKKTSPNILQPPA